MQTYVYVHPFGSYLPGDKVELDVPEGTLLPNALAEGDPRLGSLVPDPSKDAPNDSTPDDVAAAQAELAKAQADLAAANAAEHPEGS